MQRQIAINDEAVHVHWADPFSNVWLSLPHDRNEGILDTEQGRRHKEITSFVRNNALSHLCPLQYNTEGTGGEQSIDSSSGGIYPFIKIYQFIHAVGYRPV